MKNIRTICTFLFGVMVLLFFGLVYPHHLHYQEQYQLFLFDSTYVWEIMKQPGGIADLLGRFCTQFFLFAWIGAFIIAFLLSAVQLLALQLYSSWTSQTAKSSEGWLYGLSFVPSCLLWLYLLDENALLSGIWAMLITLISAWGIAKLAKGWKRNILLIIAIPILYWVAGPVCLPIPIDGLWHGVHYYRYPSEFPTLLWGAALSVFLLAILRRGFQKWTNGSINPVATLISFALVALVMGTLVSKHANFKAERVMQYDFMARYQQWNRILETVNKEKPNNQIGVTVQNLALAMHGLLTQHLFEYNQNGIAGLLPDMMTDAVSPLPTAEAFYQLGMITVAQRTTFEAQEAILDFQKSARCYQRLAQTYLILGNYEVSRKYLMALQKTLFYRSWANETLPLLGDEEAIAKHPEYGRLRQMAYKDDFYFGGHITADMLEKLYEVNPENHLAYEYLVAYYMLTGNREGYAKFLRKMNKQ
ncbi:MAG: DUF6057 family protein [Prevotella sp.]|nr:DUF6057 family protein [Prevotella sp.]